MIDQTLLISEARKIIKNVPVDIQKKMTKYFSIIAAGMACSEKTKEVTMRVMENLDKALEHLGENSNNEVALTQNEGISKELCIMERLARNIQPEHNNVLGQYYLFEKEFGSPHEIYFNITENPFKINVTRVEELV